MERVAMGGERLSLHNAVIIQAYYTHWKAEMR